MEMYQLTFTSLRATYTSKTHLCLLLINSTELVRAASGQTIPVA